MRRLTLVAILGFGIFVLFGCGERQASITGVVADGESGNPLRDAIVTLEEHTSKTGADGHYQLDGVPLGSYTITARMEGYKPYQRQIDVQGSQQIILDIAVSLFEEPSPLPVADVEQAPHRVMERLSSAISPDGGGSITVTEAESIYSNGFTLSIPPGALDEETIVTVGDVTDNFPPIPNGLRPVGLPVSLQPHGLSFRRSVTVMVPYSDEMLSYAGVTSPEDLLLKTYDLSANEWADVPIVQVDTQNSVIVAEIDHFSLFSLFSWGNREETESPATDEQITTYIKKSWGVVTSTGDLLEKLEYPNPTTAIPFRQEIGGILTVMAMAEQIQNEKYRKAAITGGEWLAWQALKAAGYGWLRPFALLVEATYKGGQWFVKEVDKNAFNAQICAYLYYRNEGYSDEEIKQTFGFLDDEGWLLTTGTGCPPWRPRLTGRFQPEDVFRIGRAVRNAKQSGSYKQRDTESIRVAFLDAIRPVEPNQLPQVSITAPSEEATFTTREAVNLAGTAVDPEDGSLTGSSLTWRIETDETSTFMGAGEALSLSELSVGTHRIFLTAKDSQGQTAEDSVEITIQAAVNKPPEVTITTPSDGTVLLEGDSILFTGSALDPEDGPLEDSSLIWMSGIDGVLGPGHTVTRDDLSPGTHAITLSATDSHSMFSTKTVTIVIEPSTPANVENMPPEVVISAPSDGTVFQEGEPIQFVGSARDPEDGSLEGSSLIWARGDWDLESADPLGIGRTLAIDDLQPGSHRIFLLAMDSNNGIGYKTVTIVIAARASVPNEPPTAYAGPDQRVSVGSTVCLDGSGSSDPNSDRLSFEWTQSSGPSVAVGDWSAEELIFAPVETGTYSFQLIVNDGQVDSEPTEVVVVLTAKERQPVAPPIIEWERVFDSSDRDEALMVQQTADGGFIVLANSMREADGYPIEVIWLIKTDEAGNRQWEQIYGGIEDGFEARGSCVRQTLDGGFVVAGTAEINQQDYAWLIKTDRLGEKEWDRMLGDDQDSIGQMGASVQQTSDSGYILIGEIHHRLSDDIGNISLSKISPTGDIEWVREFGGSWRDWGLWGEQAKDDGYILIGITYQRSSGWDDLEENIWLIKTDEAGNKEWDQLYGDYSIEDCQVRLTEDGGFALAANILNFSTLERRLWLAGLSPAGGVQWDATYSAVDEGATVWITETPPGGYVICTSRETLVQGLPSSVLWVLRTDEVGNTHWALAMDRMSRGASVEPTMDGGYIVLGTTLDDVAGDNVWLLKLGPNQAIE